MHYRKSKKILFYFFLFLLIGTLNNKDLIGNNFAKLDKISVIGLNEKENIKIVETISSLNVTNLFFLKKKQIDKILDSNSLVEDYYVSKQYPSRLIIKINKTKFLAQIKKEGENFLLGSNGKLIKTNDIRKDIPVIFGNFDNKSFFDLKKIIDQTNFDFNQIKNLFFFKSGRWDIETNKGLLIKLPRENIKKSFILIKNFQKIKKKDKIYKIDLRQKNQLIINEK